VSKKKFQRSEFWRRVSFRTLLLENSLYPKKEKRKKLISFTLTRFVPFTQLPSLIRDLSLLPFLTLSLSLSLHLSSLHSQIEWLLRCGWLLLPSQETSLCSLSSHSPSVSPFTSPPFTLKLSGFADVDGFSQRRLWLFSRSSDDDFSCSDNHGLSCRSSS